MGIYDRPYYRDETSGSGWLTGLAPACKTIILINVAVFLAQWVLERPGQESWRFSEYLVARSDRILKGFEIWRLITAPFLHSQTGPFHLLWNMLFLWYFGREMESMYGTREFTRMYLTAAVFSTLCWAIVDMFVSRSGGAMIGASGAVTAVVMLFTLYYPHKEILVMFILPMPMWLLLVIFLGSDLLMLVRELQGGHFGGPGPVTAFASHLGGALYGYVYKAGDLRWSRLLSPRRLRPRMRVVSPPPPEPRDRVPASPSGSSNASRSAASGSSSRSGSRYWPEEQFDAKLDEILAKIAREGRGGLTDEENRVLEEASRRARNKRSDRE
jgi:membrane associated rhomboid family serine protease